jgi:hypothetical protein
MVNESGVGLSEPSSTGSSGGTAGGESDVVEAVSSGGTRPTRVCMGTNAMACRVLGHRVAHSAIGVGGPIADHDPVSTGDAQAGEPARELLPALRADRDIPTRWSVRRAR